MNEYQILNILMVLFSIQIVNTYLGAFRYCKKKCSGIGLLAWGIYVIFQYWVMVSNASQPIIILLINILLIFYILRISYNMKTKTALFLANIFYVLWMLVEVATNYVLGKTGIAMMTYGFVAGRTISNFIIYVFAHIFKRYHKSNTLTDIPLKYWMRLFLIPLVTIYIIHNTFYLTYASRRDIFFLLTVILMILVNYVTFDVYDKLGEQLETEKKNLVYEQQIALCNKQAGEREAAYQETRRVRHDLNGYLVDLKTAIQSGELKEAESKINTILEHNQIYRNEVSRSGNLVIDSLINYKYSLASKEYINMKCYVFVPEQMPFDGADLCIILGNLLDNAIEAVARFPAMQRHVEIYISQTKGILSILIQNPHKNKIKKNNRGQIITSKKDVKNHGIGLESVQRSVDKYNGKLLVESEKEQFRVTILLYPRPFQSLCKHKKLIKDM